MDTHIAKVSVIIPNWNGKELFDVCLGALAKQTFRDFEVIVVDNGSTDGSQDLLRSSYPWVRLVELSRNFGFCVAINRGIEASTGHYLAFLNSDTEADPNWLAELARVLDQRPDIGFCACKMLRFSRRNLVDGAGVGLTRYGVAYSIGYMEGDGEEFSQPREVFGACAGAAIYRRELLEEIGGMDEDLFMYADDVDLSFRAQLKGYKCLFVPTAIVYHMGQASSQRVGNLEAYLVSRNNLVVLAKNAPVGFLARNALHVLYAIGRNLASTARHGSLRLLFKGYLAFLVQLPVVCRKRRAIQKDKRIGYDDLAHLIDHRSPFGREFNERKIGLTNRWNRTLPTNC